MANTLEELRAAIALEEQRQEMFERQRGEYDARRRTLEHSLQIAREFAETTQEIRDLEAAVARERLQSLRSQERMESLEVARIHYLAQQAQLTYQNARGHQEQVEAKQELIRLQNRERELARAASTHGREAAAADTAIEHPRREAVRQKRDRELEEQRTNRRTKEQADKADDIGGRIKDHFLKMTNDAEGTAKAVTDAYDKMTEAAGDHFAKVVLGQESAGEAAKAFAIDTIESLAEIAAKRAIIELAEGTASLFLNPAAAGGHFAAAALFTIAAAGAGIISQQIPRDSSSSSSGGSMSSTMGYTDGRRSDSDVYVLGDKPPSSSSSKKGGPSEPAVFNVYFGGPMYGSGGVRQAGRELAGVLNRAAVQGGVQLRGDRLGGF